MLRARPRGLATCGGPGAPPESRTGGRGSLLSEGRGSGRAADPSLVVGHSVPAHSLHWGWQGERIIAGDGT
jgi:hypothetical protein